MRIAVLLSASLAAAVLAIAAGPAGACAAGPDGPCLEDPAVAVVKGDIWIDYDLDSHRAATGMESGWQGVPRVYADLDHDGTRDPGEPQDDGETDGKLSLPVDTRLLHGETRVDVRFSFVGVDQDPAWDFAFKCIAPAAGCVRNVEVNAGEETIGVDFPVVGPGQINGMIWDDKDDDGHREAGEDGVEQLARVPRRRPRRRARPRRARTRTRRTSRAATSCPCRRATSSRAATCRRSCSSAATASTARRRRSARSPVCARSPAPSPRPSTASPGPS